MKVSQKLLPVVMSNLYIFGFLDIDLSAVTFHLGQLKLKIFVKKNWILDTYTPFPQSGDYSNCKCYLYGLKTSVRGCVDKKWFTIKVHILFFGLKAQKFTIVSARIVNTLKCFI